MSRIVAATVSLALIAASGVFVLFDAGAASAMLPLFKRQAAPAVKVSEEQPPAAPSEKPEPSPPVRPRPFKAGEELSYAFGWKGVPCADFRVYLTEEEKDGTKYLTVNYEAKTRKVIALFWSFAASGKTYLDVNSLLPAHASSTAKERSRQKNLTIVFDRAAKIARTTKEKVYKKKSSTKDISFKTGLDIPAALFYVRTLKFSMGKTESLEVLDSDKLYSIEMTPVARERIEVTAGTYETLALDVRVRQLNGSKSERSEQEAKYKTIRVWISDDKARLPVRMKSEVFVGSVYAELVSVKE